MGHGNLKSIDKIPNNGFSTIQPGTPTAMELPKYSFAYCAPKEYINEIKTCDLKKSDESCETVIAKFHDWREMPNKLKIRQGDTNSHIWENPSRLLVPLTNLTTNDNYAVHGVMLNYSQGLNSQTQMGFPYTWDGCLDVTIAPELGVAGAGVKELRS